MRLLRFLPATALAALGAVMLTASPAAAAPLTAYQMPFPCGESWTGTTRASHSPSTKAVDWNRPDDVGDAVVAAAAGVVTTAVPNGTRGYGRYVVIDHGNGESTLYAHLSSVTVGVGQTVAQGTTVGLVGETGNATGPHLHFEERAGGEVVSPWFAGAKFVFGSTQVSANCATAPVSDIPLAGSFNGDAVAELVRFNRTTGTFWVMLATGPTTIQYGLGTDQPLVGDWNGDGITDVGVRRATERQFYLDTPGGSTRIVMGNRGDLPVAGDWDGNGTWEVGIRKTAKNVFRLRRADGTFFRVSLGRAGDLPVTGDWNGDGVTDLGVYNPTTARYTLRIQDPGGLVWLSRVSYGAAGDIPVTGDWDGNGRTDLGVWNPGTSLLSQRIAADPMAPSARTVSRSYTYRP